MKTIVIREKEYKLSDAQVEAMKKMKNTWQSNKDLKIHVKTLKSLEKKGLVESVYQFGLFNSKGGFFLRLS